MSNDNLPAIIPSSGSLDDASHAEITKAVMDAILSSGLHLSAITHDGFLGIDDLQLQPCTLIPIGDDTRPTAERCPTQHGSFHKNWEISVPVEKLRVGDHIRHKAAGYERKIVAIKPHPNGGVQVKTLPCWTYRKQPGKILKHNLTGYADRWDGKTMVEDQ